MPRARRFLFAATFALGACHAVPPAAAPHPGAALPLQTLRLYETGVGYFERRGHVSRDSDISLLVPAAHIDDALKTLVVLGDGGKANVTAIEFDSVVSKGMARALAGLPEAADQPVSFRDLLLSMKGATLELTTHKTSLRGRLMDVYDGPPPPAERLAHAEKKDETVKLPDEPWLLFLTDGGDVQRIRAADVRGLRPLDPDFAHRLSSAVDTLGVRSASTRRKLRILAASSRPITIGYIAEVPVWRTTYRLVLDDKSDQGMLQGWALLHNDTDEAWSGVRVELVSGKPDSFLFPLAAPRYTRRDMAEPATELSTVPQLVDKTVDQIYGDHVDDASGNGYGYGSGTGSGMGYGSGHGRLAVRMGSTQVSGSYTGASDELAIGNLASIAQAEGVESGALFRYTLAAPLDLGAHDSALVPFLQRPVESKRITWFSSASATGRSALALVNSTGQTVPPGPIAVFERGTFAGESAIERLKPKERAFVQFGADIDVELSLDKDDTLDKPERVRFKQDALVEHFIRHHDRSYTVENRSGSARAVYLVLDVVNNSRVTGTDKLDYDSDTSHALAVFDAKPRAKATRQVAIDEALETATRIDSLTSKALEKLAAAQALSAAERATLKEAGDRLAEAEASEKSRHDVEAEIASVEDDLKRLREHLAALGDKSGSPAAQNPLVTRILKGEDKLSALRRKVKDLEAEHKARIEAARVALAKLGDGQAPTR